MKSKPQHPVAMRNSLFEEYHFSQIANTIKRSESKFNYPILNLSIGEPDIIPSPMYIKEFQRLVQDTRYYRYPGYVADVDFSTALREWYMRRFRVVLTDEELLPLNGAKDGIAHLPLALFNENDEILIPNPGYPGFKIPAKMLGVKTVEYHLNELNNFKIDIDEISSLLSPSTHYIWVNFPSNPTGQTVSLTDLEKLVKFAKNHNLFILYDNAYSEITFGDYRAPSILSVRNATDCCIEIGSFSKTYSFAGLRLGWIAGNSQIISMLKKVKSQMDSGVSILLQKLGAYVLRNQDQAWHDQMIATYSLRRDTLSRKLETIELRFSLPAGALYIWAKIPEYAQNDIVYCQDILEKHNVLFTPGTVYGSGNDRYIRVSIGSNLDDINRYFK